MFQSVSQLFHGPAPRSPLHRLADRLRHSRSNTSTEYSLPGATQLSQVFLGEPNGNLSIRLLRRLHVPAINFPYYYADRRSSALC